MVHWRDSYKFGKAQEAKVLPVIREFFNPQILPTEEQYSKYDFHCELHNYELKSRTFAHDKYPTTMITMNKCSGTEDENPLILLFNFTDALYYILYDAEDFAPFAQQMFSRAREEWDEKMHIYIPIDKLILIKKWEKRD